MSKETKLRCVQCGYPVEKLFVQYSPGNIRLMKCENCKAVADEYIECEIMILLIDLILHKPKAYRHLLYNMLNHESLNLEFILWKASFVFLLLDAYRMLILVRSVEAWSSSISFLSLVWRYGMVLMDVFFGNFMFLSVFLLGNRILPETSDGIPRYKDLLLAMLSSSYLKIFLISMMVWEFPLSVIFIIDIFTMSSNTVALKDFAIHVALAGCCLVINSSILITEAATDKCIGVCLSAHAAKFLANRMIIIHLSRYLR